MTTRSASGAALTPDLASTRQHAPAADCCVSKLTQSSLHARACTCACRYEGSTWTHPGPAVIDLGQTARWTGMVTLKACLYTSCSTMGSVANGIAIHLSDDPNLSSSAANAASVAAASRQNQPPAFAFAQTGRYLYIINPLVGGNGMYVHYVNVVA